MAYDNQASNFKKVLPRQIFPLQQQFDFYLIKKKAFLRVQYKNRNQEIHTPLLNFLELYKNEILFKWRIF